MSDAAFRTASALIADLERGAISSEELTEGYIERIERYDGAISAVIVRRFDEARTEARAADAARARGKSPGPLHGLPVTIKESYDLAGTPTSWGIPEFAGNIAATDADTVQRLKAAGARGRTDGPRSGLVTVAHLPSTVFPTGPSREGLPIGLQAVGREYDDFATIDFCRLLAREIGGFVPPPGYA